YTSGVLLALDPRLSLGMLHRNFSEDYQTLNSNAISESSRNVNEQGTYIGLVARPYKGFTFSAYYDQFKFPWLRFRVDAPSDGVDYLLQLNYKPNRNSEFYVRYRQEIKGRNSREDITEVRPVEEENRQQLRLHGSYPASSSFLLRSRVEFSWYQLGETEQLTGFMAYQDISYRSLGSPVTVTLRYALFDTESFDARIYAYEHDVLYFFNVPAYSGRGSRMYVLVKYRIRRGIDLWLRYAQSYFSDRDEIGSGLNTINGNTRSEFKAQVRFRF
ncbi:MAG: helix-hairpin-helix domain-containing protein, partial [Bacteroidota bacterium]